MQKQTQKRLKSGFKIFSWTVSTLEGGGSIMLPALYTLSSLRLWLARNARAYTYARSTGFCVIWVCISSSSSCIELEREIMIGGPEKPSQLHGNMVDHTNRRYKRLWCSHRNTGVFVLISPITTLGCSASSGSVGPYTGPHSRMHTK
jgi:hypothetical protein